MSLASRWWWESFPEQGCGATQGEDRRSAATPRACTVGGGWSDTEVQEYQRDEHYFGRISYPFVVRIQGTATDKVKPPLSEAL